MRSIDVSCDLTYEVSVPTSFVFNVAVLGSERQVVKSESISIEPCVSYTETAIGEEGNRIFRVMAEPGTLRLQYAALVELMAQPEDIAPPLERMHADLPDGVLPYLNPSRYCESDRLGQFADDEFGSLDPGYGRVTAICDWIARRMTYAPGSTDWRTTACDVLLQRTGVCRDYAHVAIALCRALGIPARYVSAYALHLEPADFHGYFEAYLGSEWYPFDATGKAPLSGLVRIGVGRDAAETSFATIIGAATLTDLTVGATERR